MSLRWRLIGGIALLLTSLWAVAAAWFFVDVRTELRNVLDARLASSARMVQGLIARGDVRIDITAAGPRASRVPPLDMNLPGEMTCQLWSLEGRLLSAASGAPQLSGEALSDGFSVREVNGESWRVYALTDASTGLRVVTAERRQLREALMREVATALSAPFLLILPAMAVIVWIGVGAGLAPLERLRRAVSRRHVNALTPLPETPLPAEIAPLTQALNDLLARVAAAVERERRFTGDAAHELRTPLTGIKAQLQVARAADGAVRERALQQAEAATDRMTRLVSQMLLLARVEGDAVPAVEPPHCDMNAELQSVLSTLESLAQQHDVTVDAEVCDAIVAMPASMLHTLLRNLIENAIHHAPAGTSVTIVSDAKPSHVSVEILDQGFGIPQQDLERVTQRFYRSGNPVEHAQGSGLGLALVAAIAQRYGAIVRFCNRSQGGLQVMVDLPIVSPSRSAS